MELYDMLTQHAMLLQGSPSLAPTSSRSRCTSPGCEALTPGLAAWTVDTTTSTAALLLEHRCMSEHVGEDEVADLRATKVHLLQVSDLAVPASHCDTLEHRVHVVLAVHQVPSVHLAGLELARDCMANALMEQLHRNASIRHGGEK